MYVRDDGGLILRVRAGLGRSLFAIQVNVRGFRTGNRLIVPGNTKLALPPT